jgi:hypothetical protein
MGRVTGASTPWVAFLSVLQVGTAITVISIVAVQLSNVSSIQEFAGSLDDSVKTCLLSSDPTNGSVCNYAYLVGGLSIVLTVVIGILQLVTCQMCGGGFVLDAVFTGIATAWWIVASLVLSSKVSSANSAGLAKSSWRNAVVILCWVTAGLFGTLFITHLIRAGVRCCKCCNGRRKDEADIEKAQLAAGRPTSAAVEMGNEIRGRSYMANSSYQAGKPQSQFMSSAI